jgi:hypothetical protein
VSHSNSVCHHQKNIRIPNGDEEAETRPGMGSRKKGGVCNVNIISSFFILNKSVGWKPDKAALKIWSTK